MLLSNILTNRTGNKAGLTIGETIMTGTTIKEYRIKDARTNKIICFIKSGSLLVALQKAEWALDLDITQIFAEEVK